VPGSLYRLAAVYGNPWPSAKLSAAQHVVATDRPCTASTERGTDRATGRLSFDRPASAGRPLHDNPLGCPTDAWLGGAEGERHNVVRAA
jgi:hypothetical protein